MAQEAGRQGAQEGDMRRMNKRQQKLWDEVWEAWGKWHESMRVGSQCFEPAELHNGMLDFDLKQYDKQLTQQKAKP